MASGGYFNRAGQRSGGDRPVTIIVGGVRACVGCGCTDARACAGGCSWVYRSPAVCSVCFTEFAAIFGGDELPVRDDVRTVVDGIEVREGRASRVADAMLALAGRRRAL